MLCALAQITSVNRSGFTSGRAVTMTPRGQPVPFCSKKSKQTDIFSCDVSGGSLKPTSTMTNIARKLLPLAAVLLSAAGTLPAASLSQDFDNVPALFTSGWVNINRSTTTGSTSWFQGNDAVFPAQQGGSTSYIGANFNATTGTNTISLWLLTPTMTFVNGDTISFFTRTPTGSPFPDRLEVRLSLAGVSTNVGSTATSVGDFTTLLLTVNSGLTVGGYPENWTQFTATISGLAAPTDGRLAFRYFVTNGGPTGDNSNYIGIDTLRITPVPEPSITALFGAAGLGGLVMLIRRRRSAA
jgi:hypothetical protein